MRRFYFRLALALGCTVSELLDRVDSAELTEWIAFDSVEPIGAWRFDFQFGMLMALQANMHRRPGRKPYEPQDFMPFLPKPEQDLNIMQDQFMAFAQKFNERLQQKQMGSM